MVTQQYRGFTLAPLGAIGGLPANFIYNGLGFDGSQLLISGGDPGSPPGMQTIYSVAVNRTNGEISSFGGVAPYATVPTTQTGAQGVLLEGGLAFAPNGTLLYTTGLSPNGGGSQAFIGQAAKSGVTTTTSLTTVGNLPLGSLGYLPNGQLVLSTTSGAWYPVILSNPNSNGIYSISVGAAPAGVDAPADAFANFPGGVSFEVPGSSIMVGASGNQKLSFYALDPVTGYPTGSCPAAQQPCAVVDGAGQAIGYGVVRDPLQQNSYLFTTENNDIWMVTGDVPEPSALLLVTGGAFLLFAVRRKRR